MIVEVKCESELSHLEVAASLRAVQYPRQRNCPGQHYVISICPDFPLRNYIKNISILMHGISITACKPEIRILYYGMKVFLMNLNLEI